MKTANVVIIFILLCAGCAMQKTHLLSALPIPSESIGLYLQARPRKGKYGAPYTVFCEVQLSNLNNTSIPVWTFPKFTFYAEQNGEFYILREIETHSGGISAPYSMSGGAVATLPRPPRPGTWNIFAVQEHSEKVYNNHLKSHTEKTLLTFVEEQDESYRGMWIRPMISNVITVQFAEIDQDMMKSAQQFIQDLIDAGQYRPDFAKPKDDPTKGFSVRFFRWRSKATTHPSR